MIRLSDRFSGSTICPLAWSGIGSKGCRAAAAVIWIALLMPLAISNVSLTAAPPDPERYERRQRHMGTEFVITAVGNDPARIDKAMDAAFAEIQRLDSLLSDYQSDSEVSRLSASCPHAQPIAVSDDLGRVLGVASRVHQLSDGAFDVTVGPFTRLWRRSRRTRKLPEPERWESARAAVGFGYLRFDGPSNSVQMTRPHMRLDLGGIAKGYALDAARRTMQIAGIRRVLIDGGGDIVAGDAPEGRAAWRIGVSGLSNDDPIKLRLDVNNRAVATSGDLWQFVEIDGTRYSHFIDPRSGLALNHRSSVTVIAPTGIQADAWASALTIMEPRKGMRVLHDQAGLDARIVRQVDGRTTEFQTRGFRDAIASEACDHEPETGD